MPDGTLLLLIRIICGVLRIFPFCICAMYVSFHHLSGHVDRMRAPVFLGLRGLCSRVVVAGCVLYLNGALVIVNILFLRRGLLFVYLVLKVFIVFCTICCLLGGWCSTGCWQGILHGHFVFWVRGYVLGRDLEGSFDWFLRAGAGALIINVGKRNWI